MRQTWSTTIIYNNVTSKFELYFLNWMLLLMHYIPLMRYYIWKIFFWIALQVRIDQFTKKNKLAILTSGSSRCKYSEFKVKSVLKPYLAHIPAEPLKKNFKFYCKLDFINRPKMAILKKEANALKFLFWKKCSGLRQIK